MNQLFPEAFLAQVQCPNAVAVIDATGDRLTYGELERRSRGLAWRLRLLGAGPEAKVGILIERSFDMVVSVVAVLRAGAAYVPLDTSHPSSRLRLMARDARPTAVIARSGAPDLGCEILDVEDDGADSGDALDRNLPQSAAYVIYTSGSTGKPKGTVIEHRSLAWLLKAARSSYDFSRRDRVLQFSSLGFDLSVLEILPTLACGATVVLRNDTMASSTRELFDRCRALGVTVIFPPTSFWHEMADAVANGEALPSSLRLVAFGTERVDPRRVRVWRERRGPRLVNAYGATETTVDATRWEVTGDALERIPIGRPVLGVDVRVRAGELVVAGPGLARGYLDEPRQTAAAFVPDPESATPGHRLYLTGDHGRQRPDGHLEILGRVDHQLKIRGFRIEPGEIEEALSRHSAIRQAAVVRREEKGRPYLAAFVVPAEKSAVTPNQMRQHLETLLPSYMVPSFFFVVDRLALTASGKIDRRVLMRERLPAEAISESAASSVAARSAMEVTLARIWADVLRRGEIGIHDDFFALGGDSILGLRIAARAHEAGVVLDPKQLFRYPTIADLAPHVAPRESIESVTLDRRCRDTVGAVPGPVPLTPIQRWFFELDPAEPWHFNQAMLLEVQKPLAPSILRRATARLIEHHDALRLRFIKSGGRWRQRITRQAHAIPFIQVDLSRLTSPAAARKDAADALHASLDLAVGPLLRAALFNSGTERPAQLMLAIHHLSVDTVSWHILLGDLETLCGELAAGREGSLPGRTTTYQEWSSRIETYGRSEECRQGQEYFSGLPASAPALPRDRSHGANIRASADTVSTTLGAEPTDYLLRRVSAAYQIRIHEIVLSAVARAVTRWTGQSELLIEVESHGRESLLPDVDLTRTVGWFTTSFPLLLDLSPADEEDFLLSKVRDQLRAVPDNGFAFFCARYLGDEEMRKRLGELPSPEIHFNFLGQLDAMATPSFALSADDSGRRRSSRGRRPALFEVEAAVVGGCLEIHWCFSRAHYRLETVEGLAESCQTELCRWVEGCLAATSGDDREVEDVYPLTPVQRGLLFHALYAPESQVYHEQYDWDLEGGDDPFDPGAFHRAWQHLVDRHAVLRTTFSWRDLPRPIQVVRRHAEVDWRWVDLERLEPEARELRADELAAADRRQGFDFEAATPLRCTLIRLGDGRHRFVWSLHHLLLDGWSVGLVLDDLAQLYAGHVTPRPRPFGEYVGWLGRQNSARAERFWRRQLKGMTEPTPLVMGEQAAERDAVYQRHGEVERRLSPSFTACVDRFIRRGRLTWGTLLAGAWAVVLARTSGCRDVVFGSTSAGRPQSLSGSESMVGLMIQTLPIRVRLEARGDLRLWLEDLRDRAVEIRDHGSCSLTDIREWSQFGDQELFESVLGLHNFPGETGIVERRGAFSLGGLRYFSQTHYPLAVIGTVEPDGLRLQASFDPLRFKHATIARTLAQMENVLRGFVDRRDLASLTLLSEAQRHQLRWEWNAELDLPEMLDRPLQLMEAQAARRPDAVAVIESGVDGRTAVWTYSALDRHATILGRRLRDLGVGPEWVVGILTERSFARMVAMLGIWKAEGAFLLLDPGDPVERREFMLDDSGTVGLVIGEGMQSLKTDGFLLEINARGVAPHPNPLPVAPSVPEPVFSGGERGPEELVGPSLLEQASTASAAYVVYTSGSTGRPKGTVVPHSALSAFLGALDQIAHLDGWDRMLVRIPVSFDAALIEMLASLAAGAQQVLVPPGSGRDSERLVEIIRRQMVTATATVPSVLRMLLTELDGGVCPSLRHTICGGEVLLSEDAQTFARVFPRGILWNAYGPAEATVAVAAWHAGSETPAKVPIGRPLAGGRIQTSPISDMAPRVAEEVCIGGPQLARGYLGQPRLTAERFSPAPVPLRPGERLYRSGDLGRRLDDGALDFIGRTDHQVKVRGVRVELGEIEAVLAEHPAVRQSAVIPRRLGSGDLRLVAFVLTPSGVDKTEHLERQLKEHLATSLPESMCPASFFFVDPLPLLASGKVDRKALTERIDGAIARSSPRMLRGPIENGLAEIWQGLLGLDQPPDRDSNLFELGAHSLIATQAVSRIRRRLGVELTVRQIFEAPTVAGLAARVDVATPVEDLPEDSSEATCVGEWKALGEALHTTCEVGSTTGWTSSYTGEQIPEVEMREWVADTVERLQELTPSRVLEIGCGTGLLLFELAAECEHYLGTDLSSVMVDKVATAVRSDLPRVDVRCQAADDFTDIPNGAFDTVVVNSVIQYFPSVDYLVRVLRGAVRATAPGGQIFVGDVRNLLQHDLFCASVERFRAGETTLEELSARIRRRRNREKELLIDPAFFFALRRELPRIARVALRPKSARAAHEMSLFRYDVVLELDREASQTEEGELLTLAWPEEISSLSELRRLLVGHRERVRQVSVHGFSDRRLVATSRLLDLLGESPGSKPFRFQEDPMDDGLGTEVIPADLLELGRELGYVVEFGEPPFSARTFDLVFRPTGRTPVVPTLGAIEPWRAYGNDPTTSRAHVRIGRGFRDLPPLVPCQPTAQPELSFAQQRLWFVEQLTPDRPLFNLLEAWEIQGPLDGDALEAAWREMVRRHDVLRACFPSAGGRPRQEIAPTVDVSLPRIDLTCLPADRRVPEAKRLVQEENRQPLDLARGPIFRMRLIQLGEHRHVFVRVLHHIASDGWSEAILSRELGALYDAARHRHRSPLPDPPVQYADFALWQRSWLCDEVLEQHLDYWRQELADLEPLELPTDRPRPTRRRGLGRLCELSVPAPLNADLHQLAERYQASPFMVLLATFMTLIKIYTGRFDFAVASPVANRRVPETEDIVGFFVNSLILRSRGAECARFSDLLARVRATTLAAYAHQDLPFERLVEELQPSRELDRQPLFQVVFALHNTPDPELRLPGLELSRLNPAEEPISCDMEWHFWQAQEDRLDGFLVYDPALFDSAHAERMAGHFVHLLTAITADPDRSLRADALFSRSEAEALRTQRATVRRPEPQQPSSAAVSRVPDRKLEADLLAIWREVLEIETIGVDDNFFDLGGHSLLATQVRSRIRERLGRRVSISHLFEHPTVARLTAYLEAGTEPSMDARSGRPAIRRQKRGRSAPTSFAQERLWFLEQLFPGQATYNMPRAWHLRGRLDRPALRATWGEVVRRHQVLRTTFPSPGGQPRQTVSDDPWSSWLEVDLTRLARSCRVAEARRLVDREAVRPFDLDRGPLLRVFLFLLEPESEALMLRTTHHIASDGWSETILDRELTLLYRQLTGRVSRRVPSPLSELPVQYVDYALWQRQWLSGETLARQLRFWRRQLEGLEPLRLPTDRRYPAGPETGGAAIPLFLDATVAGALERAHRRAGASLYMLLASALLILLRRLSGQHDLAIGSPSANRGQREIEGLVGFFVNPLVLRCAVDLPGSLEALLGQVRKIVLETQAHQDLPFEKLVEELAPDRDPGRNPLFQVSLALETRPSVGFDDQPFLGLEATDYEIAFCPTRFDLSFHLTPSGHGLSGWLLYRTALFDRSSVERMARHFTTLLRGIADSAENGEARVVDLPWLRPAELHQLCCEWSAPVLPDAVAGGCVHEIFAAVASRHPGAAAVVGYDGEREQTLSYRQLDRQAGRLAGRLRRLGVGPEIVVGLYGGRRPETVIGLLAVLKAGGAYLPLDPDLPAERLAFLLGDSRPVAVLAHSSDVSSLSRIDVPTVLIDEMAGGTTEDADPASAFDPAQTAYVLYTSGSTGRPKGVAVEHRQLVSYVRSLTARMALRPDWTYALALPLSVDSSVTALWPPLLTGACLLLVSEHDAVDPRALGALASRQPIDVLKISPSHYAALVGTGRRPPIRVQRRLIFGGEALRPALAADWHKWGREAPDCQIHNHYGPTEATVGVFSHRLRAPLRHANAPSVPLGRPFADTVAYVVDDSLRLLAAGIPGELVVGGQCLARGYLRNPGRTAASFIPDPWSATPGARLYLTGDQVRYLGTGNVEYLGRRDLQIKIRGRRVELAEIENLLAEHSGVREAVCWLADGTRLMADVETFAPGSGRLNPAPQDLREWLAARLPNFMVPETLRLHRQLPRAANGKVDRLALATPSAAPEEASRSAGAPSNAAEATLLGIWESVLGRRPLGVDDNFFDLGGHSLLATRIVSRVRSVFRVELAVRHLFDKPSVRKLAPEVAAASGVSALPLTRRGERPKQLPLSFAQQRLWFLQWLAPEGAAYNIPYVWELVGALDVSALERSLTILVRRHETLRTTFPSVEGRPVQRIGPPPQHLRLPIVDLGRRHGGWRELLAREGKRPFDLTTEGVLRCLLLRLDSSRHVLFLNIHHIASDGWSRGVLYREISRLYQGSELPELPVQYVDFALWQRQWLASEALETRVSYWRRQLAGLAPLELPTDRPRPEVVSFRGASHEWTISGAVLERLQRLSVRHATTLYMTLLAAFSGFLSRLSGRRDVAVGTPIAGRGASELEGLIGFFVNMLVMRLDLRDRPRFSELLSRARRTALEAYAHQDLPFERLVDELAVRRDTGHHPLFQVALALQNAAGVELQLPGLEVHEPQIATRVARLDLELFLSETGRELSASIVYSTDLFDATTVARFASQLTHLLQGLDEGRSVLELPLLTPTQAHQLRIEWNDTAAQVPWTLSLHQLFEAQVRATPDALVTLDGDALSYRHLDRWADQVAYRLQAVGIGPECFVGLFLERSFEMLVSLLAVLKAGGAFVPLDPGLPEKRLRFLIRDSGMQAIMTLRRLIEQLPKENPKVIAVDEIALSAETDRVPRGGCFNADHAAYLTYTSGSTGVPKGVITSHRSIVAHLVWWQSAFPLGGQDRVLQKTTLGFDVAIWEVFMALLGGARLVLAQPGGDKDPDYLVDTVIREGVTVLHFVPSMLPSLLDQRDFRRCQTLRWALCGGETLPRESARRLQRQLPHARVVNLYGPTETTVTTTTWRLQTDEVGPVPIGDVVGNTCLHLFDADLQPVPSGAVGEILLGGAQLSRGYRGRSSPTAAAFIPNAVSRLPGERLYKTGDLGCFRADSALDFLGRIDRQVQIRGVRIELGEIESALLRHPAVGSAAVIERSEDSGLSTLVACVVAEETPDLPRELRAFLRQSLPDVMVPRSVVALDDLPHLASGKIDRAALAQRTFATGQRTRPRHLDSGIRSSVAPRTPAEKVLADIWRRFLDVDELGVHDNFFDLGGDSILSIRIVAEVNRTRPRGLRLSAKDFFQHQTIAGLAQIAVSERGDSSPTRERPGPVPMTPIQLDFLEWAGREPWYFNQATLLRTQPLEMGNLEAAVAELLQRHASLRLRFRREHGRWRQTLVPFDGRIPVHRVDLSKLDVGQEEQQRALSKAFTQLNSSLDLASGPLMRVGYFSVGREDLLLITIHHLAVDRVSWRILLEDLESAYVGKALPPRTTSFAEWAEKLEAYAGTEQLRRELPTWSQITSRTSRLPVDFKGRNTLSSTREIEMFLSRSATRRLKTMRPLEVMLLALVRAFATWTGRPSLSFELEGHGREEIFDGVDLSRTVGWFTSLYPVFLNIAGITDVGQQLSAVGEQLHGVPAHGLGYGVLRHLDADAGAELRDRPRPEVLFNYLGILRQPAGSLFTHAKESPGALRSVHGRRVHLLEANSAILDERFMVRWRFSLEIHRQSTIQRLATNFFDELRSLLSSRGGG